VTAQCDHAFWTGSHPIQEHFPGGAATQTGTLKFATVRPPSKIRHDTTVSSEQHLWEAALQRVFESTTPETLEAPLESCGDKLRLHVALIPRPSDWDAVGSVLVVAQLREHERRMLALVDWLR